MTQRYKTNTASGTLPAGTIVYALAYHDYGLASDDTRITGVKHISVTLNPKGDYPSFTHPLDDLDPLPDEDTTPDVQVEADEPSADAQFFVADFEDMAFVTSRQHVDVELGWDALVGLARQIKAILHEAGINDVVGVHKLQISEDDEQDDEDIKVFVSLELVIAASSEEQAEKLAEKIPGHALSRAADLILEKNAIDGVALEGGFEFVAFDDPDGLTSAIKTIYRFPELNFVPGPFITVAGSNVTENVILASAVQPTDIVLSEPFDGVAVRAGGQREMVDVYDSFEGAQKHVLRLIQARESFERRRPRS